MARAPSDLVLAALLSGLGGDEAPIDATESPWHMVDKYALRLDKRAFEWDEETGYSHLVPLFQDTHPEVIVMASAQSGKTGWLLARALWTLMSHWGCMMGWYFPDALLPAKFSQSRFAPFVRGNPHLRNWLGRHTRDGKGQDATHSRTFGPSRIYFETTEGRTSTESMPFQAILFDEVRRMRAHAVQLAEERTSAQRNAVNLKVSTANYPNTDIDMYFRRGDQRWFHTECDCADGVILSKLGQECILDLRGAQPSLLRKVAHAYSHAGIPLYGMRDDHVERYAGFPATYWCPTCGKVLVNPRVGWWEPHQPDRYAHSYQLCQALSPMNPAPRVLEKIDRPTENISIQEVWNSVWGLPFIDKSRQPVDLDTLLSCVNDGLSWARSLGLRERRKAYPMCYLGADVQRGYLAVVIKAIDDAGKWCTVHVEVAEPVNGSKWQRLAQLMEAYSVDVAVIDAQPDWDEALAFAKTFPRRVWLAEFQMHADHPMVLWQDKSRNRKEAGQARFKYIVKIGKVKAYKWSLGRFEKRWNTIPSPKTLVQILPYHANEVVLTPDLRLGRRAPSAICQDVYFKHLCSIVIEDKLEGDDDAKRENRRKEVVVEVGSGAHFADANLYADVACSRRSAPRLV